MVATRVYFFFNQKTLILHSILGFSDYFHCYVSDFGYVKTKLLTLKHLCSPSQPEDSELQCTEQAQLCTGRRIKIDFRDIPMDRLIQYDINVLKYGQMGGNCNVRQDFIASNSNYMSALQSWAPGENNVHLP